MQEDERLKHEKSESAHLVSTAKDKGKKRKRDEAANGPDQKKPKKNEDYLFCKKVGHVKKECTNIMLGVLRKVCSLLWSVLRLI